MANPAGSLCTDVDEVSHQFSASLSVQDRHDLLFFSQKLKEFELAKARLESNKKYISRNDRDLLARFLLYFSRLTSKSVEQEVRALHSSTRLPLSAEIRRNAGGKIDELMSIVKINQLEPENDRERFDQLVVSNEITSHCWDTLRGMGVHRAHVLSPGRKLEVMGTSSTQEFFDNVRQRWNFVDTGKYFHYIGGVPMPAGAVDGGHVLAGSSVQVLPTKLLVGNGT